MPRFFLAQSHQSDYLPPGTHSSAIGACHTLCVMWLKLLSERDKDAEWLTSDAAKSRLSSLQSRFGHSGIDDSEDYLGGKTGSTQSANFNRSAAKQSLDATVDPSDSSHVNVASSGGVGELLSTLCDLRGPASVSLRFQNGGPHAVAAVPLSDADRAAFNRRYKSHPDPRLIVFDPNGGELVVWSSGDLSEWLAAYRIDVNLFKRCFTGAQPDRVISADCMPVKRSGE